MQRSMFYYFKKVRPQLVLAIFFIMAEALFEALVPYIYTQIVDVGLANNDIPYIYLWGGLMVLTAFFAFVTGNLSVRYVAKVGMGYATELREAQFAKIQSLDASKRNTFPASSLITRMTNDTYTIQNTIITSMRGVFRAPFMLIMVFVLAFSLNPQIAVVFALLIPIVGIFMFIVVFKVRPIYKYMQQRFDTLNKTLQENLTAIRVVKAYVTEKKENTKFISINNDYRRIASKAFISVSLNNPMMQLGMYASFIGIIYVGGNLIVSGGDAKIGEITGLITYVMQFFNNLLILAQIAIMISRSFASITRIKEVLSLNNDMEFNLEGESIVAGAIEFRDVSFKYPDSSEHIIKNIHLSLKQGEILGIIGQTGSGKTTLVSLIARLYDVTSGEVLIDDVNVKDIRQQSILKDVNIVFQNNVLFAGTIRENLAWGKKEFSEEELDNALKTSLSDEIIGKLNDGLESQVGQAGQNLSGGQKQRLGLARALLRNPKILILDDCLNAIDTINEAKIRKNIKKNYPDLTLIVVSQRITGINNADNIVLMHEGVISAQGSHKYLLKNSEIYKDIYDTQKQGASL